MTDNEFIERRVGRGDSGQEGKKDVRATVLQGKFKTLLPNLILKGPFKMALIVTVYR